MMIHIKEAIMYQLTHTHAHTLSQHSCPSRSNNIAERKKYIALVEQVRLMGGAVLVFSTMHTSGEQLTQLTGVAAILHFPLPDLEDEELEDVGGSNSSLNEENNNVI